MDRQAHAKANIRDVSIQLRSLRRILLQLQDDLGDVSIDSALSKEVRAELETMNDSTADMEHELHKYQERLLDLSK